MLIREKPMTNDTTLAARVAECDADKALLFQCEDWLERADKARLEAVAERDTLAADRDALKAENERLRKALLFYADRESWVSLDPYEDAKVDVDEGDKARAALREKTDD